MVLLDISATGEENVIDENSTDMNDLEYRKKQLQQLKDTVVDLEDMAGGVSITDLTLNDFRMDLSDFMNKEDKKNLRLLQQSPKGLFSAVTLDDDLRNNGFPSGVIFCLKNIREDREAVQVDDNYPIAPYFLVYVSDDATVVLNFTQSKKALDVIKRMAYLHKEADESAVNTFDQLTSKGKKLEHYQHLLAVAVDSIAGKSEEKGVESLFTKGGTVLTATSSQGIEDFMVVSYLVLMDES